MNLALRPLLPDLATCKHSMSAVVLQEEFLQDLCAFHRSRGIKNVSPDNFPDAILNGSRLDVHNLYREVTSRGGFRCGRVYSVLLAESRHP